MVKLRGAVSPILRIVELSPKKFLATLNGDTRPEVFKTQKNGGVAILLFGDS